MATTFHDTLTGRRALVTGGTKGVGAAIAHRLTQAGATVLVTARREAPGLADKLFIPADLARPDGAATVIEQVAERLGGLDILVHNVGGSDAPAGGFAALDEQVWLREVNLNLLAAVRLDRGLLPAMIANRSGAVVHVSSRRPSDPHSAMASHSRAR